MNKLNKKIYKVDLYMIDKDASQSFVKKDYKTEKNLYFCKQKYVTTLLIYCSHNTARELITDRKIPYFGYSSRSDTRKYFGNDNDRLFFDKYTYSSLKVTYLRVGLDEAEKYLEEKLDPKRYGITENYVSMDELRNKYLEELNNMFDIARLDYDEVLSKASFSTTQAQVKYENKLNKVKAKKLRDRYL